MSFKDEYTKMQSDIKPRAEFLEELAGQMEQARQNPAEPLPKKKSPMKLRAVIIAAGAVTAAAAAAAFAFAPSRGRPAPLPVNNAAVTNKFSYTVGLFAQNSGLDVSENDPPANNGLQGEDSSAPSVDGLSVCSTYPNDNDTSYEDNTNISAESTLPERISRLLAQDGTVVYKSRENRFGDEDRLSEAEIAELAEKVIAAVPADGAADKDAYWYMAMSEDGDIVKFLIPSGRGKGGE